MAMTISQTTILRKLSFRMIQDSRCCDSQVPTQELCILICMNLLQRGLANSFRGLRTGDVNLIALGAAMLFVAWFRSTKPSKTRVYKKRLRPGEAVTIRFTPPVTKTD